MVEKLDWLKRFICTFFGFILFGIVGLLLKIVLFSYRKSHPNNLETQLTVRQWVGKIWQLFLKYLILSGVIEVKYSGFDRLGRVGQLVLANHPSLLDVVLIFSQESRLNCIVKKDLLHNPTMRDAILSCGFLLNTESEELLEQSHCVLQQQALLIFPEGTRTGWNSEVKLHRGAVSIGLRSAKVITPVVIKMNPLSLKKNHPWYKIPSRKICYELTVGEDIDPKQWLAEKPLPIASRRLNDYLENYFNTYSKD